MPSGRSSKQRKSAIDLGNREKVQALQQGRNRADYKPLTSGQRKAINTAVSLTPVGKAVKGAKAARYAANVAREKRVDKVFDRYTDVMSGKTSASPKSVNRMNRTLARADKRADRASEGGMPAAVKRSVRDAKYRMQDKRYDRLERKDGIKAAKQAARKSPARKKRS